jgi:2-isopropylmalate synthase
VLLDSSDGQSSWGTIGVSENIIEASWEALVDSLEYVFQPRRQPEVDSQGPGETTAAPSRSG